MKLRLFRKKVYYYILRFRLLFRKSKVTIQRLTDNYEISDPKYIIE